MAKEGTYSSFNQWRNLRSVWPAFSEPQSVVAADSTEELALMSPELSTQCSDDYNVFKETQSVRVSWFLQGRLWRKGGVETIFPF